jgi:enhancing lycopene biosynthesis protein 2
MKVAVLLSGSGVFDGTEIQEAVISLLALNKRGIEYQCTAPNIAQHHVINHLNGEEVDESRNVLEESARIARGEIVSCLELDISSVDGLLIPGGFGTAKNHTKWAVNGPDGEIIPEIRDLIRSVNKQGKPILALCMAPTTLAKAFEGSEVHASMTVGSTEEASPYEIGPISQGMESIGAVAEMKTLSEISVDEQNKIVTAPCYMMEGDIGQIYKNIEMAMDSFVKMLH